MFFTARAAADEKPTHDSVVKDYVTTIKALTKSVRDIKDASTMDKTKAEFEKAKDHFEALNDRLIDLGKPPADQKEKWNKNIKDADASLESAWTAMRERLKKKEINVTADDASSLGYARGKLELPRRKIGIRFENNP
jgi:hypothetical protein